MSNADLIDYKNVIVRLENQFEEISGEEFYEEIFPDNERSGEQNEDYSKPNAIFLWRDESRQRRRIMLQDTWAEDYLEYVDGNPRALCSGLVYRGRANKLANAQKMNAMIFDLDGVGDDELRNLLYRSGKPADLIRTMPMPTYLVASGTGLHVYYVLEEPMDLFPATKRQLKDLKDDLTYRLWDYGGTTKLEDVQYQSIAQTFRMVGSINEKYGNRIRAFRTGAPVSLETLNEYAMKPENRVDPTCKRIKGMTPIVEAKKKWPDWYQKTVVEGKEYSERWDIAGKVHGSDPYALYHWWIRQTGQIKGGHRYFFMFCLVAYARKCNVPYSKLKDDMKEVFERLKTVDHIAPLTEEDMKAALNSWKKDLFNLRLDDIEKLTALRLPRNKRNGRKQAIHLERARAVQLIDYPGGSWRNKDGRPKKQQIVEEWQALHPAGRKADCIKETGLSKPTVYKWWKKK